MHSADDSLLSLKHGLIEAIHVQATGDPVLGRAARDAAWGLMEATFLSLQLDKEAIAHERFALGASAEEFWRQHDAVVLLARLQKRAAEARKLLEKYGEDSLE